MHYTITCATCDTSTQDQIRELQAQAADAPAGRTPATVGCDACPSKVELVKDDSGAYIVRHLPEDADVDARPHADGTPRYALLPPEKRTNEGLIITITQRLEDVNLEAE